MKKTLSVLLAVAILVCALPFAVFAEPANTVQFEVTGPTGKVSTGETIDVKISLVNNPGIAGVRFKIGYNTDDLTLVSATVASAFSGDGSSAGNFTALSTDKTSVAFVCLPATSADVGENTATGEFITYKFKVKANGIDESTDKTVPITATIVEDAFDAEMNDYTTTITATTNVTVKFTDKLPMITDVDGNDEFDSDDAIALLEYYLFGEPELAGEEWQYDYNQDGNLDSDDAIQLLEYYLFEDPDLIPEYAIPFAE